MDYANTLLMLHEDMSTFDLYELVYFHVKDFLLPGSKYRGLDAPLWWRTEQTSSTRWEKKKAKADIQKRKLLSPFVLKFVKYGGKDCSRCTWTKFCHGCVIFPSNKGNLKSDFPDSIESLFLHIAVEWDSELIGK